MARGAGGIGGYGEGIGVVKMKAWVKAAVACAAMMMSAPVWGGGPGFELVEVAKSTHWTFKVDSDGMRCLMTGYVDPNDPESDRVTFATLGESDFMFSLTFDVKHVPNFKSGDELNMMVLYIDKSAKEDSYPVAWNFKGAGVEFDESSIRLSSNKIFDQGYIFEMESSTFLGVARDNTIIYKIPLPVDFSALVNTCLKEQQKRAATPDAHPAATKP